LVLENGRAVSILSFETVETLDVRTVILVNLGFTRWRLLNSQAYLFLKPHHNLRLLVQGGHRLREIFLVFLYGIFDLNLILVHRSGLIR
jgi:hypothetical protein